MSSHIDREGIHVGYNERYQINDYTESIKDSKLDTMIYEKIEHDEERLTDDKE